MSRVEIERRLHDRKIIKKQYEIIRDRLVGKRLYSVPVEENDVMVMVVSAYYLGSQEDLGGNDE